MNKTPKWEGVVTKLSLPVRVNPNAKAKEHSFSPISMGVSVEVCDTAKGWLYISVGGKYGYVSARWIKFASSHFAKPSKTARWTGKTTQSVRMRSAASKKASFQTLRKGTVITVCDTIDGYWYIKYQGSYGYVSSKYVTCIGKAGKAETFLASVKAVQEYARAHNYYWADSQSNVPCADGKISCDRLVARALWDMGYHDQCKGGIALGRNFEAYLMSHGFKRSTNMADAKAGSVMVVMNPSKSSRHVFVVASRSRDSFTRYDCGSTDWIRSKQPLKGLWMAYVIGIYNI